MGVSLKWSVRIMRKCFVAPNKIDISKQDRLSVDVAMTRITQAIENKELTVEQFERILKRESKPKTEKQNDSVYVQ